MRHHGALAVVRPSVINDGPLIKIRQFLRCLAAKRPHPQIRRAVVVVHEADVAGVAPPIHVLTTFRYSSDPSALRPFHERDPVGYEENEYCYSRHTTPSTTRLEEVLSFLLENPYLTYSSSISAFHALLTFLNPKRVAITAGYHGYHGVLKPHQRLTGCKILPLDCDPEDLQEAGRGQGGPSPAIHPGSPSKAAPRRLLLTTEEHRGYPMLGTPLLTST